MRIDAAISGDLRQVVAAELAAAERAVTAGVRETGEWARTRLREQGRAANLRNLARAWKVKFYPTSRPSLDAAALVYVSGRRAAKAMYAYEKGATIRAAGGRFLAIPTGFNRKRGRRRGEPRVTPAEMVKSRMAFILPGAGGTKVWCLRVTRAQRLHHGQVQDIAAAGGLHIVGSMRRKRTASALAAGFVPMFTLVPQVRIAKRIDVAGIAARAAARLPAAIVRHWQDPRR